MGALGRTRLIKGVPLQIAGDLDLGGCYECSKWLLYKLGNVKGALRRPLFSKVKANEDPRRASSTGLGARRKPAIPRFHNAEVLNRNHALVPRLLGPYINRTGNGRKSWSKFGLQAIKK